jgi:hypothetical protein
MILENGEIRCGEGSSQADGGDFDLRAKKTPNVTSV